MTDKPGRSRRRFQIRRAARPAVLILVLLLAVGLITTRIPREPLSPTAPGVALTPGSSAASPASPSPNPTDAGTAFLPPAVEVTAVPLTTQPATPVPSAAATSQPLPTKEGWRLVFNESFNEPALNTQVWSTRYPWGDTNPPELERYVPGALALEPGMLRLTADRSTGGDLPYTSGMISSHDNFYFQYGYVEIRAKPPSGPGLWPALWLLTQNPKSASEIDIMEILGQEPNHVYLSTHFATAPGQKGVASADAYGPDFSKDFHTFAVEWDWNQIIWFIDGKEAARTSDHIPHETMYLIANLAVGGTWPGPPNQATTFPANFDIAYIRVFAR